MAADSIVLLLPVCFLLLSFFSSGGGTLAAGLLDFGCHLRGECLDSTSGGFLNAASSNECLQACKDSVECGFYTFYASDDACFIYLQ